MSNAIKFSKSPDTIEIMVETKKSADSSDPENIEIIIQVVDHGIGISPKDLKNLFLPYFKTSEDLNRVKNMSSHGMGLNIS